MCCLLHDEHSVSSGGADVDIVQSGSGAADQPQFGRRVQHLARHFRLWTNDQHVVVLIRR